MVRTQIQLSEQQYKALKRLSELRKVSMAELIRQGVDGILKSSASISDGERRKRAIAVAGRFHSGKSDVSEKHDKYLDEAMES